MSDPSILWVFEQQCFLTNHYYFNAGVERQDPAILATFLIKAGGKSMVFDFNVNKYLTGQCCTA